MITHPIIQYSFDSLVEGLMACVNDGSVKISQNGSLALFNYTPECAFEHRWNEFSMMARGLILDMEHKQIVALPFTKFFNASEREGAEIVRFDAPFDAYTKMDGCAHESTVVQTDIGPRTIREICELKLQCRALTYNVQLNELEYNKIENFFIQDNNDDWYELTTIDGNQVKLTGNHKVWIPKLSCYRRVDELNGCEEILFAKVDG